MQAYTKSATKYTFKVVGDLAGVVGIRGTFSPITTDPDLCKYKDDLLTCSWKKLQGKLFTLKDASSTFLVRCGQGRRLR